MADAEPGGGVMHEYTTTMGMAEWPGYAETPLVPVGAGWELVSTAAASVGGEPTRLALIWTWRRASEDWNQQVEDERSKKLADILTQAREWLDVRFGRPHADNATDNMVVDLCDEVERLRKRVEELEEQLRREHRWADIVRDAEKALKGGG